MEAAADDLLSLHTGPSRRRRSASTRRPGRCWTGSSRPASPSRGVLRLRARLRGWLRDAKGRGEGLDGLVLEKRPDDVLALVERSTQYRLAGYPTEAMRDLERAIELAPGHPTRSSAGRWRGLGEGRAALRGRLERSGSPRRSGAGGEGPVEDVESFYFRGRAKEELGRKAEARMDYERALGLAPPFIGSRGARVARAAGESRAGRARQPAAGRRR